MYKYDSAIFSNQQYFLYIITIILLFSCSTILVNNCNSNIVCRILYLFTFIYIIFLISNSINYTIKNRIKKEDKIIRYVSDCTMLLIIFITFVFLCIYAYYH